MEAVFLYKKAAHVHHASERLLAAGMPTWAYFNAYHSALIGAVGILSVFGVSLVSRQNRGWLVDTLFDDRTPRQQRMDAAPQNEQFIFIPAHVIRFDHTTVWSVFERLLKVVNFGSGLADEVRPLAGLKFSNVSRGRNLLLYTAHFWPSGDLIEDVTADLSTLDLSEESGLFLLGLGCAVYSLFDRLLDDVGTVHRRVRDEIERSRVRAAIRQNEPHRALQTFRSAVSAAATQ